MIPDGTPIWPVIILLGIGTFFFRFSFLALVGERELPEWVLRHLRYTAVAVMPALITPLVFFPPATNGELDPARLAAAAVTLGVGVTTKNVLWAVISGAATLYGLLWLLG
ncbi:AzlD domain-containing protein [Nereida sp. MMG025]|uniref:AzlD domain-containing protein n=1 Tax=Nereida sp. MMG025 TaxID=2909981 RepID=UPI001F3F8D75|nr:AzlD domain-containing protein [Nereida sp. MMG025]MCF6444372.1 AzlD domain-containing protein [Nereida sp. MMG025]